MMDEVNCEATNFPTRTSSMKVVTIIDDGGVYRISNQVEFRDLLDVLKVKFLVDVKTKQRVLGFQSLEDGEEYSTKSSPTTETNVISPARSAENTMTGQPVTTEARDASNSPPLQARHNISKEVTIPSDKQSLIAQLKKSEESSNNEAASLMSEDHLPFDDPIPRVVNVVLKRSQAANATESSNQPKKKKQRIGQQENEELKLATMKSDMEAAEKVIQGSHGSEFEEIKNKVRTLRDLLGDHSDLQLVKQYHEMAQILHQQGEYEDAVNLYQISISITLEKSGDDSASVVDLYMDAAHNFARWRRFSMAIQMIKKALDIELKSVNANEGIIAMLYLSWGRFLQRNGQFKKKPVEVLDKALNIRLKLFGEDDSRVADVRVEIGNVLKKQGKFDEAMTAYKVAHKTLSEEFGDCHPRSSLLYVNMGSVLDLMERKEEASEMYKKAFSFEVKGSPKDNADSADIFMHMGDVLEGDYRQKIRRHTEASRMYRTALSIRLKAMGKYHILVSRSYKKLGCSLLEQNRCIEALAIFEKELPIGLKLFGEKHRFVSETKNYIAGAKGKQRHLAETAKCEEDDYFYCMAETEGSVFSFLSLSKI